MSKKEVHFMTNNYQSVYGSHIQQFISMKRKFGFGYIEGATFLSKIDMLAVKWGETSLGITKEFSEKWTKKRLHESVGYQRKRISHLMQFSSHLCSLGISSYIPKLPPVPSSTFIPYIYSQKEIHALFEASDQLRAKHLLMKSCLICFPVLLRLLYGTGIRISEALSLKDENINLNENCLRIKDCKNGKERIIPISSSLANVCSQYLSYRNTIPFGKVKSNYFLVKLDGGSFQKQAAGKLFKKCLSKAGIPYIGRMHGPRIHDLRHTFAVTSLASMAEAGIDLYVSLPILSNYLGHQSLEATNNYVRLTANMYPDLIKDVDTICLDVFPKNKYYEAD